MICMVKAFGYGAGSFELAKTLQDHRCDYVAVAVADEEPIFVARVYPSP